MLDEKLLRSVECQGKKQSLFCCFLEGKKKLMVGRRRNTTMRSWFAFGLVVIFHFRETAK